MAGTPGSNRALLAGLAVSLAVHLGVLVGLGRAPLGNALATLSRLGSLPDTDRTGRADEPLELGIAQSQAATDTWIGFPEATPHRAPEASTEQPALSRDPGDAQSMPAAGFPAESRVRPNNEALQDSKSMADFVEGLRPLFDRVLEAAAEAVSRSAPPRPAPGEQSAPPEAKGLGGEGEASDRDSDSTALVGTIDIVPGHPAARQGLEIKTVRPTWSMATRMTASPANPTVLIRFLRDGKVYSAEFDRGKGTGYPSVDGPLLDAVYAWRASGRALERLPAGRDSTLEVRVRVILR